MTSREQDLGSLFQYTPGEAYGYLAELREQCPVHWDPMLRGNLLTKYDDVYNVMFDNERFRLQTRPEEQYADHQPRDRVRTFNYLLSVRNLRPRLQSVVQAEIDLLLDRVFDTGHIEIFEDLAETLPAHVIGTLFGLDREYFPLLLSYRRARSALFNAPPDAVEIAQKSAEEQAKMDERMRLVLADHRANPRDNLLSQLIEVKEDDKLLDDDEIMQIVVRDLLMAGSETVTNSLCNSVHRMMTVPGMYGTLRTNPDKIPAFMEEALRYDPPVQFFWRAANEDVELSGCPIAKDAQIYTSIAGANRDPEVFDDPDDFDIDRPNKHITFSVGTHKCPGAFLARSEISMSLETLLRRLSSLRRDDDAPPPEFTGVALRYWAPLHLRFDSAADN